MNRQNRVVHIAGAAVGLGLFLAVALLPALMYGGYAGVLLASGIFHGPIDGNLFARGLVVFGMALGVFATASVFAVSGAASAALIANIIAFLRGARGAAARS